MVAPTLADARGGLLILVSRGHGGGRPQACGAQEGLDARQCVGEDHGGLLPGQRVVWQLPLYRATGHRPVPEFLGERDLKVFAAVEGGPGEMVVSTDPIELVPRPWYMREVRDGYAVLVVGESMIPAFKPGDMAIVNPRLPPLRGQDVVLIGGEQVGEFRASLKHLEGWDARAWKLRQYNPPRGEKAELSWPKRDWPKALRVVGKYYG